VYDAPEYGNSRRREHDPEDRRQGGDEKFLETLGFVVGGKVTVVSQTEGNLIVNIKESRVAIGKDMANKIMV
jgi:ferrous iron transport protein A